MGVIDRFFNFKSDSHDWIDFGTIQTDLTSPKHPPQSRRRDYDTFGLNTTPIQHPTMESPQGGFVNLLQSGSSIPQQPLLKMKAEDCEGEDLEIFRALKESVRAKYLVLHNRALEQLSGCKSSDLKMCNYLACFAIGGRTKMQVRIVSSGVYAPQLNVLHPPMSIRRGVAMQGQSGGLHRAQAIQMPNFFSSSIRPKMAKQLLIVGVQDSSQKSATRKSEDRGRSRRCRRKPEIGNSPSPIKASIARRQTPLKISKSEIAIEDQK
ncbi:hypothetical protein LXL04_036794 [Taraxacum kok-saghyz]